MLTIEIPEPLQDKIRIMARQAEQTPEQLALEVLEEHLDHRSAYIETAYLQRSARNRQRLDQAIEDIKQGKFQPQALIDD